MKAGEHYRDKQLRLAEQRENNERFSAVGHSGRMSSVSKSEKIKREKATMKSEELTDRANSRNRIQTQNMEILIKRAKKIDKSDRKHKKHSDMLHLQNQVLDKLFPEDVAKLIMRHTFKGGWPRVVTPGNHRERRDMESMQHKVLDERFPEDISEIIEKMTKVGRWPDEHTGAQLTNPYFV